MDIAETLATTEDFVASETETGLSVNNAVFPQPGEGALVSAGKQIMLLKETVYFLFYPNSIGLLSLMAATVKCVWCCIPSRFLNSGL